MCNVDGCPCFGTLSQLGLPVSPHSPTPSIPPAAAEFVPQLRALMAHLPADWDILYLTGQFWCTNGPRVSQSLRLLRRCTGTYGMVLRARGALKVRGHTVARQRAHSPVCLRQPLAAVWPLCAMCCSHAISAFTDPPPPPWPWAKQQRTLAPSICSCTDRASC